MSVRFPGQRRPPGQSPAHLAGAGYADLAVLPPLTLVGDRGRHVLRVLDGCAPFGSGCDELVSLLADACAPVDPLELRGEGEALAAFRAANGRDRLPVAGSGRRVAARRASRRPHQPAAGWSGGWSGAEGPGARSSGAAPLLGSALAVAASAVVMIFAYAGSLAVAPQDVGQPPAAVRPALADRQGTEGATTGGGSVIAEPGRTSSGASAGGSSESGPTGRRGPASPSGVDGASVPAAPGQFAAGQSPSTAGSWLPAGSAAGPAEPPAGGLDESGSDGISGPSAEDGSSAGPGMAHGEHGAIPGDGMPGNGPRVGQNPGQNPGQNSGRNPRRGPNSGKVTGKNDTTAGGLPPVSPVPEPAPSAGVAPTAAPSGPIAGSSLDVDATAPMSGVVESGSVVDTQIPAT